MLTGGVVALGVVRLNHLRRRDNHQFRDSTAVVRRTVNAYVVGSIPTLGAKYDGRLAQSVERLCRV